MLSKLLFIIGISPRRDCFGVGASFPGGPPVKLDPYRRTALPTKVTFDKHGFAGGAVFSAAGCSRETETFFHLRQYLIIRMQPLVSFSSNTSVFVYDFNNRSSILLTLNIPKARNLPELIQIPRHTSNQRFQAAHYCKHSTPLRLPLCWSHIDIVSKPDKAASPQSLTSTPPFSSLSTIASLCSTPPATKYFSA